MEGKPQLGEQKFSSPQEEIAYLRAQVEEKEAQLAENPERIASEEAVVREEIREYAKKDPDEVLTPELRMKLDEIEHTVLHLEPGHDEKMNELVMVMEERGLRNALSVLEKLNSPHLEDDFHRLLVQYLVEVGGIPGIKEGTPMFRALNKKLFEITLLKKTDDGTERRFTDLVSGMEQLYAGLMSLEDDPNNKNLKEKASFTFEIAQSNDEEDIVMYAAVPKSRERLFEKQLLAFFPDARLREKKEDYNIFADEGTTLGSYAQPVQNAILPIKTHGDFEQDPLNVMLTAFQKIKKEGEGAAIQFVLVPKGHDYNQKYKQALQKVKKGVSLKEATQSVAAEIAKEFGGAIKDMMFGGKKPATDDKEEEKEIDEELVSNIEQKIASPIMDTNIRIVASAFEANEAETILSELEAAFNQFAKPNAGGFVFRRAKGRGLSTLLRSFSFRLYEDMHDLPLNTEELTTVMHFPVSEHAVSDFKDENAKQAPAPNDISSEGVVLGTNSYQGEDTLIRFGKEDRVRHFYVIGQTGTGKTTILKNMIAQDIRNGDGVCFIDPHGSDINDILSNVPQERIDDVIYFDPAYTERPMGLNMLEYDQAYPEQKTFVVNELFGIFQKLYGGNPESMGPMFEQYFRNATQLVIEDPASGSTLMEVSRVMSDESFRKLKLSRCRNPIVKQFWEKIAGQAGGEASLQNIVPYITSKFDVFMANDIMRPIIAQEKSAFNFRDIMDERKILLINLSKGRLGDINSSLIGLIIVGKILMAALSRVDASADERHDFYLYIDEFQNVTTDSISAILSEARKYRLSLNIAHQFIAQLDEKIKDAVFGNVGSMAVYRVGTEDAQFLESQFTPTFAASDIMNIDNYNAYVKMLVNGQPQDPFNMAASKPETAHPEIVDKLKELSYLKYGAPRARIEESIAKRFKAM